MADTDEVIRELARTQHGVVARRQLRRRGVSSGAISRRIRRGTFERLSGRVVRIAAGPLTEAAMLMAAVLDAGPDAVVSHRSAAALWRGPGFSIAPVEVTGRRGRVRHDDPHLAVVHQPRLLLEGHVVELDGVPVTTPSRTVFDLAGAADVHPKRLERLLDTLWSRNLVSHASLARMMDELAVRGRTGIRLMRELLAARPADYLPPGSNLESRFQELALAAGLSGLERQVDMGDEDGWIGRVDFLDRERGLVVEVDSVLHHGSLTDRRVDQQRHAALEAAGLTVVSVTDEDLFHRRAAVIDRIRRAASARPNNTTPVLVE